MGFISQKIGRSELQIGDHIYTWRSAFIYSHHGIYIGEDCVIHFTCDQNMGSDGDSSGIRSWNFYNFCASSSKYAPPICPNFSWCVDRRPNSGVVLSCLDCFLGGGDLHRFEYGVASLVFLGKIRGGTCTMAESDPPGPVVHRAMYLLDIGFGNYNVLSNNCEDFALYCKTGRLMDKKGGVIRVPANGQAASAVASLDLLFSIVKLRTITMTNLSLFVVDTGTYAYKRYKADLVFRTNPVVPVEKLSEFV